MNTKTITLILKSLIVSLTSALTLPILELLMYNYSDSDLDVIFFVQSFFNITCIIGYYYIYRDDKIKLTNSLPIIFLNFFVFYVVQLIADSTTNSLLIPAIFSTYSILIIQFLRSCHLNNLLLTFLSTVLVQCVNLLFIISIIGLQNSVIAALFYIAFPLFDYLLILMFIKLLKLKKR